MAKYTFEARRVDDHTFVWDSCAKDFFDRIAPRLETYSSIGGYLDWDQLWVFGGTLRYDYLKYRDTNGNIITTAENTSVKTYTDTYDRYGLAELPQGYVLFDLLCQNKNNPYVEIKIVPDPRGTVRGYAAVEYKKPTLQNIVITREHNNTQYKIAPHINYIEKYDIEIIQFNYDGNNNNKTTYTVTDITPGTSINVKYNYLHQGTNQIKIIAYNGDQKATLTQNFVHYVPSISNLQLANDNNLIDSTTTVIWESIDQKTADIYINDSKIASVTGNQYVIPIGKLKEGSNSVKVVVNSFIDSSVTNGQVAVEAKTSINCSRIKPTISNVKLANDNNLIDNVTSVTWESTNQTNADIYVNNTLIGSVSNIKLYTIPKGKLKEGSNTIKVIATYVAHSNIVPNRVTAESNATINCSRIKPTVSNLSINQSNIDKPIEVKWNSTNQSRFEIYANGIRKVSGTTATKYTFVAGAFTTVIDQIQVIVYYDSGFDTISVDAAIQVSLVADMPIIYNLEPDGLNRNVDENIDVTFATNEFIDRWELTANNLRSTGTLERKVTFGKGSFKKGNNTLSLTVYYSPLHNSNIVRTANKIVTFFGYGYPNTPILDNHRVYSTATPTITWQSEEQVEFELEVYKDTQLIESRVGIGNLTEYTLKTLENKTTYTVKVRVKNKYGLWSEWATKTIETLFNDIILPEFYLATTESGVQITLTGHQDINFKIASIYRKDTLNDWIEIADECNTEDTVLDYTCPANVEVLYKIRVYDKNNAYKDTEVKSIVFRINHYIFTNLENYKDYYSLIGASQSVQIIRDVNSKIYSGQSKPRIFVGKTNYKVIQFNAKIKATEYLDFIRFIEQSNLYNIFCIRDIRGNKTYAHVCINAYEPIGRYKVSLSLTATEINFRESKMYSGSGYRKLTYLNGEYLLDGSIDLTGYDDERTNDASL